MQLNKRYCFSFTVEVVSFRLGLLSATLYLIYVTPFVRYSKFGVCSG